jgi:hypothetical protein
MNQFEIDYVTTPTVSPTNKKFNSQVTPVINIGYFLPTGRNFNRLFILPELRLYRFEHTGTNESIRTDVTFKTSMVIAPSLSVGYFLVSTSQVRIFIAPGLSFLKLQNNRQELAGNGFSQPQEPTGAYTTLVQAGGVFGKRIVVLAKYSLPVSITGSLIFGAMHSSLQVTAGYKF